MTTTIVIPIEFFVIVYSTYLDNCFAPNPHNHHLCLILQIGKLVKYIHCTINYTNNKVLHFYYNFQSHGTQRTPSLITE